MHRTCIYHRIVSGSKAAKARFTCHFTLVSSTTALTHCSRCCNFLRLRLLVFQVRSEVGRHRHRSIFSKIQLLLNSRCKNWCFTRNLRHLIAAIATSDFEIFEQPSSSAILEMPPMPPIGSGGHQGQLKGGWLMGGHKSYAFFWFYCNNSRMFFSVYWTWSPGLFDTFRAETQPLWLCLWFLVWVCNTIPSIGLLNLACWINK